MERLKVILMGSGALACPLLEGILAAGRDDLVAVVTQPDRAGGRGMQSLPCVVKTLAQSRHLPVFTPDNASGDDFVSQLAALQPDVVVVACYGQFLKRNLLAVPRIGTINVHPSLLPKYRGASPIQWALANGESETGVSVLYVTPKMDAGDILAQEKFTILPNDDFASLEPKLAAKGAELLVRVLDGFRAGTTQGIPQDETQVTFARKLAKEDGLVDWSLPAEAIRNQLRGFSPWPGAYTFLPGGILLKIHEAKAEAGAGALPGTVLEAAGAGPLVATGRGALRLTQVQPAGKKSMPGAAFLCGHRLQVGERWGAGP
ncbi:MAG TPA: methionyl-tRNA formyltransferase [Verrucomicrobia bacterium]|nr:methionyl-tRNA formyltransferase [Verrucomicrobiota bacterium]